MLLMIPEFLKLIKVSTILSYEMHKGPFIYYVSTKGGGRGVGQMLIFADEGGRGGIE